MADRLVIIVDMLKTGPVYRLAFESPNLDVGQGALMLGAAAGLIERALNQIMDEYARDAAVAANMRRIFDQFRAKLPEFEQTHARDQGK